MTPPTGRRRIPKFVAIFGGCALLAFVAAGVAFTTPPKVDSDDPLSGIDHECEQSAIEITTGGSDDVRFADECETSARFYSLIGVLAIIAGLVLTGLALWQGVTNRPWRS
jgi:hypothetical protein